ncbi:MAG: helix-turn-helix domain-containing protein [Candidatus Ranarchaeia archaeon]
MYPTKKQETFLAKHFGSTRFIFNYGLNKKITTYQQTNTSPSYFDLTKELPKLKEEHPWLKEINAQSLQMAFRNLNNAFSLFFNLKKGFPKFKKKNDNNQSFQIPQSYKIKNNKLHMPKLNKGIKMIKH